MATAPVSHGAGRIVRGHALERFTRGDELERVLQRDRTLERRLELGAAAHRERDRAELLAGVAAFGSERRLRPDNEKHRYDQVPCRHGNLPGDSASC